jgi:hypothetical protein
MSRDLRTNAQILSASRAELGSDEFANRILTFQAWLLAKSSEQVEPSDFISYAYDNKRQIILQELKQSLEAKWGKTCELIKPLRIAISDIRRRSAGKSMVTDILTTDWWKPFLSEPNLFDLKPREIERLDQFLSWIHIRDITSPCESDYLKYSEDVLTKAPLEKLLETFRKLGVPKVPQIEKEISSAIVKKAAAYYNYEQSPRTQWSRKLSVEREKLPVEWGKSLTVLESGVSQTGRQCPPKSVIKVMRELLCAYAFFCEKNGFSANFDTTTMIAYLRDSKLRGVKASTRIIRVSKLHDFTRHLPASNVDDTALRSLAAEQRREAKRETAQKFINRKIHSFREPLTKAVMLLERSRGNVSSSKRSMYLRHALALCLLTFVPLRSGDTNLRLCDEITFDDDRYWMNVKTSKTGERINVPLCHFLTPFFDALILQGCDERLLPTMREKAIKERQLLFSFESGQRRSPKCVANIWRRYFNCGPHFARTLLHEELGKLGPKGLEQALLLCVQKDERTAVYYRGKSFYDATMLLSQEILFEEFSSRELEEFAPGLDAV